MQKWQIIKNAVKQYDVKFIEFGKVNGSPLGQNTARWVGFSELGGIKTDKVLFMDVDQIFEKQKFTKWYNEKKNNLNKVMTFAIYFYSFRYNIRACLNESQANHYVGDKKLYTGMDYLYSDWEKAGLLVDTNLITRKRIFQGPQRWMFCCDPTIDINSKSQMQHGLDGTRMLHHYAYVRSNQQLFRKIDNFAHKGDKDWSSYLKKFTNPNFKFDTTIDRQICHSFICKQVQPIHNIITLEQFDERYKL